MSSGNFVASFAFDVARLMRILVISTLIAFTCCIFLTVYFNGKQSTKTHCKVKNYLPSISTAFGVYAPQKYIWRIVISLQISPRFLYAGIFFHNSLKHKSRYRLYPHFCKMLYLLLIVESCGLAMLTYVSSRDWYLFHKFGFMTFLLSSVSGQALYLLINTCFRRERDNSYPRKFFRRKVLITFTHIFSLLAALYFFWRHNAYCETGVFSLFAFFEYVFVVTNMAFHYVFVWDFKESVLGLVQGQGDSIKYSIA